MGLDSRHPATALQHPDHYAPLDTPPLPRGQRITRDVLAGLSIVLSAGLAAWLAHRGMRSSTAAH